eukprot:2464955-Prymnesium_polylepis.1
MRAAQGKSTNEASPLRRSTRVKDEESSRAPLKPLPSDLQAETTMRAAQGKSTTEATLLRLLA